MRHKPLFHMGIEMPMSNKIIQGRNTTKQSQTLASKFNPNTISPAPQNKTKKRVNVIPWKPAQIQQEIS